MNKALGWFASTWSTIAVADLPAALVDLSEANMPRFNAENPDDPRVRYFSWAGVGTLRGVQDPKIERECDGKYLRHPGTTDRIGVLLAASAPIAAHWGEGWPTDGLIAVRSAKWGEFRGCLPMDHLDMIGQIGLKGPQPNTGFDHIRFYRNLAYDLQRAGF